MEEIDKKIADRQKVVQKAGILLCGFRLYLNKPTVLTQPEFVTEFRIWRSLRRIVH